jgi:hypothetical protein
MTSDDWNYGRAVAANIVQARARLKISQKALGKRMAALGYGWRQQIVGAVESGERRLLIDELPALAICLETTIRDMLRPSKGDWEKLIAFPSGETVSPDFITSLFLGLDRRAVRWTGDRPEFGPETKRTPDYSLRFEEVQRALVQAQPVQIEYKDNMGSVTTITMPPVPSAQAFAITSGQEGGPGLTADLFQSKETDS